MENDLKKRHQSDFCKRNRDYGTAASAQGSAWIPAYSIKPGTVFSKDGQLSAVIHKTINDQKATVNLPVTVSFLESGTARVTIDEEKR